MAVLNIPLPEELETFEPDLRYFMETMVRKLHINRHKGFAEDATVTGLVEGLADECRELYVALEEESQYESALEAVDISNMAFLIALKLWGMTKAQYEEERDDNSGHGRETQQLHAY